MERWGHGKRLSVQSRTEWLIIHFPPGLQIEWSNEGLALVSSQETWDLVPVLPLIPYDLRWLRPEGRNFSMRKVRLVRPFFSSSQGYGRDKEHHIYERDGSELGEDLASTRNKTRTSEVDEAHRMYHFNPLHCNCRRPEGCRGDGAKGRFGTGRHRGPSESRSEWHFRKSTLCWKRHTII